MAKAKKKATVSDLMDLISKNFPEEVMSVPGEGPIDMAIRILSATQPAEDGAISPDVVHDENGISRIQDVHTDTPQVPKDKILVDKALFYQMFAASVKGYNKRYSGRQGMTLIAQMLGAANNVDAQMAEWKKCSDFLEGKG